MIKLIEDTVLPSVNFTDGFSVTKIKANFLAYNKFPFLFSWYQQSETGDITAIIQKLENTVFIAADALADMAEIGEFMGVIGYSSVSATPQILTKLGLDFKEYQVLFLKGENDGILPPYPDIKKVFNLLYGEKNKSISPTDFDGFYADLSHKIRKGYAAALNNDNAVCVASHITENTAVISGVAVQSKVQKSGLGSSLLKQMITALGRRKIFTAAEEKVVPFYIKNGFSKSHKIAIYETEETKQC